MGLTTGHVFSDGDTVTAAKLNAMVNNATISADTVTSSMLSDDVIESRHIADGAITSNHIASGAVSLGIISSETSAPGTIIQSGSGGTWEELSPGTTGMLLTSNGADTALTFGLLGSASLGNTLISGLVEHTNPIVGDLLMVKDTVAGVNKSVQIQNLYKTVNDLNALSSSDIADPDEFLVIDGGSTPKKITYQNLRSSLGGGGLPSGASEYYEALSDTVSTIRTGTDPDSYTWTHGLGQVPRLIEITLVCVSAELGYSVDDEVSQDSVESAAGDYVPFGAVYKNASSVIVSLHTGTLKLFNLITGSINPVNITESGWKFKIRAWK
jgi:hypothetical protein